MAVSLFLLVLILKSPILNTPHYWDAMNRVHNADWVKEHGFNPLLEKGDGMLKAQGRPPLFFILLALAWTLLGQSLLVSHLLIVLFSFLGLLSTYLLGRHLVNPRVGFMASLLLFFSPLYFAQSGILNYEVPLTALSVMVIFFALKKHRAAYGLAAAFLVLTKETGMLILIPVALVMGLRQYRDRKFFKAFAVYASPIGLYLLWLGACRISLGWFLFPSHTAILNFSSFSHMLRVAIDRSAQLFFRNGHWALSLVIIAGAWTWKKARREEKQKIFLLLSGLATYLIFFSLYSVPLDRYLLPVYPLLSILFFWSLDRLSPKNGRPAVIALILMASLFILNWKGHRSAPGFQLETNLEYLDFIEVHAKAAQYIENHFPDKHILTDWPQTMELRFPFEGYVTKPIRTSSIFEPYNLADIDLVYYVPQGVMEFREIIGQLDLVPLAKFEKNGKQAEIYKLQKRK